MATLEKLRQKAGTLVAVVIGLSLIAFILGDFLNSGSGMIQNRKMELGEINGKTINYLEFNERVEQSVQSYKDNSGTTEVDAATYESIRAQVWSSYLNEYLFENEYNEVGVAVSDEETWDMVQGRNPHPQLQQVPIFINQQTGEFDRNLVIQFLKNMESDQTGQAQPAWLEFEKEMMRSRVYTKFQNLISKGLYVTQDQVEVEYGQTNKKFDFQYVSQRFAFVHDSLVPFTEEEVEAYYNEHQTGFQQTASRDLSYVTFDVLPSPSDYATVENWIRNEVPEFKRIENAGSYVKLNADSPFNELYFSAEQLDPTIIEWVETAAIDSVFGPYQVGDIWKLARITDIQQLSDSVRASHILLRPDETNNIQTAQTTADSLVNLINNGTSFESLAEEFGTDGTAQTGGDLDWFTMEEMIPEFSKACFFGKKGDLTTVQTMYGVHVIKITDQGAKSRKYQVAYLDRLVTPSTETIQNAWDQASRFASTYNNGEKFDEGVIEENLTKRVASNLREGDKTIAGLENPRQMILWAYEADEGDMSEIFEFGNRFVIAKLDIVRKEGTAPLDQVRGEVENFVRNDKKAQYLKNQFEEAMGGAESLVQLASNMKLELKTSEDQYFTSTSLTGIGIEPKLTAAITKQPVNTMSEVIAGTSGVYVFLVTNIEDPIASPGQLALSRKRLEDAYAARVGYAVFGALEQKANIVDNRNKFY